MSNKIGFISLGCAKNLVNSEQMMYLLRQAGFEVSGDTEGVDAVVVNTCGFIEPAKAEAIDTILELAEAKKKKKIKKIIVTGCLAQRYKDEMPDELPEIDSIVGVGSFDKIVDVVRNTLEDKSVRAFGDIDAPDFESDRVITTSRSWAYIKIAEGCDNRCAFCVIPDIRGRFRSRPMENIIAEAEKLAGNGIKELIVVAQDTTRYGIDLYGRPMLKDLLNRLSMIDGLHWIRLHYMYPDEIDDELIEVIAGSDKILKYLDIPIQHINDGILKTMRRRGTGTEIRELFEKLRDRIPGVVLRTSIIAGLPGEGEAEFDELCEFLREARIERAGVFPYFPEEGTAAYEMERPDTETAQRRARLINDIQSIIIDDFNESRIGSCTEVLCEGFDGKHYFGRSFAESPDIDGRIYFSGSSVDIGDFVNVGITGAIDGEPVGIQFEE